MFTNPLQTDFDAIVVGGSYAGLSAALQLARARRRVLAIDSGLRRNRFAQRSHGFLGQDGHKAADIANEAKAQLLAYKTVSWLEGSASHVEVQKSGFVVTVADNQTFHGARLVLAIGVVDELPIVEGLADRWGESVFHCPYCHAYELDNGRIGVLATSALSYHHAMLLPDWGQVTFFTNNVFVPDDAQRNALSARGVAIEPGLVKRIVGVATVELANGRLIQLDGLFTLPRTHVASSLAEQLGCAFDEGPMGAFIRTDANKATTISGVFACGDAARMAGNVATAVADGALAGIAAHQSMIFDAA